MTTTTRVYGREAICEELIEGNIEYDKRPSGQLWSLFDFLLNYTQKSEAINDVSGDVLISHKGFTFHFKMDEKDFRQWHLTIKGTEGESKVEQAT